MSIIPMKLVLDKVDLQPTDEDVKRVLITF